MAVSAWEGGVLSKSTREQLPPTFWRLAVLDMWGMESPGKKPVRPEAAWHPQTGLLKVLSAHSETTGTWAA